MHGTKPHSTSVQRSQYRVKRVYFFERGREISAEMNTEYNCTTLKDSFSELASDRRRQPRFWRQTSSHLSTLSSEWKGYFAKSFSRRPKNWIWEFSLNKLKLNCERWVIDCPKPKFLPRNFSRTWSYAWRFSYIWVLQGKKIGSLAPNIFNSFLIRLTDYYDSRERVSKQ